MLFKITEINGSKIIPKTVIEATNELQLALKVIQ